MNEIIEKLIDWCKDNKYGIILKKFTNAGGHYLEITLGYEGKRLSHEFYLGGDSNSQSWKDYRCDYELLEFLKRADLELKGE